MYTLMVKGDQAVEQSGRVANAERRKSEHTIAKKSDIRELHRQNKHQKQIIRMLLEQVCIAMCLSGDYGFLTLDVILLCEFKGLIVAVLFM